MIKVSHDRKRSWINYSRYLYEKHKGPVPPGLRVIHRDGDLTNHSLDNLVLGTGGDVLWVHCHADPKTSAAAETRRKAAAARANQMRTLVRRMTQLLPSMWYPVDPIKRCVINTPAREVWRLLGCRSARHLVGYRLGWPDLQASDACMLAVLVEAGGYLSWSEIRERVRLLRQSLAIEPAEVASPALAQSGMRLVKLGLAVRKTYGVYAATPKAVAGRGSVSPYAYVRGREIPTRFPGYPLLSPEGAAALPSPRPQAGPPASPRSNRGWKATALPSPRLTPNEIESLMRKHERMVWWVARRVMPGASVEDLEDCASEVRLRFLHAARAYDPSRGTRFGGFAVRLGTIYALRWKYAQQNRGVHVPNDGLRRSGLRIISLDALSRRDRKRSVAELVGAPERERPREIPRTVWTTLGRVMTAKQFEMIKLRFMDGLAYREIAARFGCTASNVRQVIDAALRAVRHRAPELKRYLET